MAAVLYAVTLVMVNRLEPRMRASRFAAVALGGSMCGAAAAGGWVAMGVVLAASSAVQIAPSLWAAFRSQNPHAIAPEVWMIGVAEALLWGLYGWWQSDTPLMVYAATTSIASAAILTRYMLATRRAIEAA